MLDGLRAGAVVGLVFGLADGITVAVRHGVSGGWIDLAGCITAAVFAYLVVWSAVLGVLALIPAVRDTRPLMLGFGQ